MKTDKFKRLQAVGWKVGNAEDFIRLSDEEARLVALKLPPIGGVKTHILKRRPSQICLMQRMKSSNAHR